VNELIPRPARGGGPEHRKVSGWENVRRAYLQYLHDESRLAAERVEALHFPTTAEEVVAAVRAVRHAGHRAAISAARTGITGAAVPIGAEEIISLDQLRFTPVVRRTGDGGWAVRVAAGTSLAELADALEHGPCEYPDGRPERPLFYPIDSTEMSAHVGGTIATNASGARTLHYGPTRDWVDWLKLVTADGRILALRRGEVTAAGTLIYRRPDGSAAELHVPDLPMPPTKHTAGYHLRGGMDALDLFIGSEGTLGIICEAELRLAEKPGNRLFLTQFADGPDQVVAFVRACKETDGLTPLALEYIGPGALALVRSKGRQTQAYLEVSRLPEDARAAVYTELPFGDEAELDRVHAALCEALASAGLDPARSWAGFTDQDMEQMKRLRHAVPETVNALIGRRKRDIPELHKVGTDMAVPDAALPEMMAHYHRVLEREGIEFVVFGHIGNGHVHVNMLPTSAEQLDRAKEIYADFAREAVRLGGSVAAEHGIGRIKKEFLSIQFGEEELEAMRAIRRTLDPDGILNPGVLFDE